MVILLEEHRLQKQLAASEAKVAKMKELLKRSAETCMLAGELLREVRDGMKGQPVTAESLSLYTRITGLLGD